MSVRPPLSAAVPLHTATKDSVPLAKEVPDIIQDPNSKRRYEKGKFLGKGGFAKCYELKDLATGETMAGKIVPKSMLTKTHQKDKMAQVSKLFRLSSFLNLYLNLLTYCADSDLHKICSLGV